MDDGKQLAPIQAGQIMAATQDEHGVMSVEAAAKHWERFRGFVSAQLKQGTDYGAVGDEKNRKPGLFRPGAEKILMFYGLGARIRHTTETVIDWKQPFFHYACEADVFNRKSGLVISTAQGSANSLEDKFRWQWMPSWKLNDAQKKGTETREVKKKDGGIMIFHRMPFADPFSQVNNIDKRAGKRALVAATLIACAASDFFSQDEEDDEPGAHEAVPTTSTTRSQEATATQPPSGDLISDPQRKRFFAIWKAAGKTEEEVKAKLMAVIGSDSSKNITRAAYESLCNWAQAGDAKEA